MAAEKILVVDDEPHIRQALQAALESDGYLVLTAENGKEGVEKCKSFKPALAILDVRMPVMDGHMASIEIKYDDQLKNTKIIFLTANTDDDSRNYGLGHGAEMYLNKPFQVDDLLARVGSLLRPNAGASAAGPSAGSGPQAPSAPAAPVDDRARAAYLENLKKKLGGK
jgi:two-component system alkaline phosphatase synthesis response regulator PhoP